METSESVEIESHPREIPLKLLYSPAAILDEDQCHSRWLRIGLLVLIGFGPLFTMLIFITKVHDVFIAMLVMHWACMVAVPLFYTYLFARSDFVYYKAFLKGQAEAFPRQIKYNILVLVVSPAVVYVGYLCIRCDGLFGPSFCAKMKDNANSEGMDRPISVLVVFGIYFILVNPFIEELFWRVFLYNNLGAFMAKSCCGALTGPAQVEAHTGTALHAAPVASQHVVRRVSSGAITEGHEDILCEGYWWLDPRFSESVYITLCAMYASYHFVVCFHLLGGWIWAVLAFVSIASLGRLLLFMKNSDRFGLSTAVACHMGVDLGAVLCLSTSLLGLLRQQ